MRILLTHSPEARALYYGDRALAGLRKVGDVKLHEGVAPLEGDALIAAAADCDLIVSYRQSPGPAAVFERLPKLIAFLRCAIDIRNVDVPAASKSGVLVTQASAGFVTSVAEQVFGFLIDLSRGITSSAQLYHRNEVPGARMGRELKGSTLGVIGYGAIGKEVVRIARVLGMKVLTNDPYKKMKRGAYLINVSRGNLVDEQALEAALQSGHLAGCAMDVGRAADQMPTPRLAARSDVIATPHTAGLTLPAIEHQSMDTVAQAGAIAKGRAPKGAVNAKHWTRKALLRK